MKKNYEEAFKWYMMSASVGNAKSQYQVAMMLSSGMGVEKNEELAKRWFATYSSTMVNDSRKVAMDTLRARRGDITLSNDLLKAMSRNYQPNSMVTLATKYHTGKGFKRSEKGAMDLLNKASLAGGSPRTKLAELIAEKKADEGYPQESFDLVKSAAEYGDATAMYKLAMLYKDGICCDQDMDKYRMYMRMSAEKGNHDAKEIVMKWNARSDRRKAEKTKKKDN